MACELSKMPVNERANFDDRDVAYSALVGASDAAGIPVSLQKAPDRMIFDRRDALYGMRQTICNL